MVGDKKIKHLTQWDLLPFSVLWAFFSEKYLNMVCWLKDCFSWINMDIYPFIQCLKLDFGVVWELKCINATENYENQLAYFSSRVREKHFTLNDNDNSFVTFWGLIQVNVSLSLAQIHNIYFKLGFIRTSV